MIFSDRFCLSSAGWIFTEPKKMFVYSKCTIEIFLRYGFWAQIKVTDLFYRPTNDFMNHMTTECAYWTVYAKNTRFVLFVSSNGMIKIFIKSGLCSLLQFSEPEIGNIVPGTPSQRPKFEWTTNACTFPIQFLFDTILTEYCVLRSSLLFAYSRFSNDVFTFIASNRVYENSCVVHWVH